MSDCRNNMNAVLHQIAHRKPDAMSVTLLASSLKIMLGNLREAGFDKWANKNMDQIFRDHAEIAPTLLGLPETRGLFDTRESAWLNRFHSPQKKHGSWEAHTNDALRGLAKAAIGLNTPTVGKAAWNPKMTGRLIRRVDCDEYDADGNCTANLSSTQYGNNLLAAGGVLSGVGAAITEGASIAGGILGVSTAESGILLGAAIGGGGLVIVGGGILLIGAYYYFGGGSGGNCTTTLSDPFGLFAANGGQGDDNLPEYYYD
jgi:hypothetical protein